MSDHILKHELPRPAALLFGGVLSLMTLSAFPTLINHFGSYRPPHAAFLGLQHPGLVHSSALGHMAPSADGDAEQESATSQPPTMAAAGLPGGATKPNGLESMLIRLLRESGFPQLHPEPPNEQGITSAMPPQADEDIKLDAAERQRVIQAAIANLKEHYVDPATAQQMAETLQAHEKAGDYDAMTDGSAFATLLTKQLGEVSHDLHLGVIYSRRPLPEHPPAPNPERMAAYRKLMEQQNCTFEKVEILAHNIGYVKFNFFPDPSVCQSTAAAVMASLNNASAIIFDLRDNRGGFPDMVMFLAAYLFDHPEYMYNPRANTTEQSWTRSPVPGNKLADKRVYVLTSSKTISGAEHFSYNLKMLKRATLVGETTGGEAHSGVLHRLDEHFLLAIPEVRPINPYSKNDWAVTGVEPDVKVKAADALDTAEKLAESKLQNK